MLSVLPPLIQNFVLAMLLGAVVSFAVLIIWHSSSALKLSLLWALAVVTIMSYGYPANGYLVDFRHLLVLLAGYAGGHLSLILPFSFVAVIRLIVGGGGTTLELVVLFISALIGITLRMFRSRLRHRNYFYAEVIMLMAGSVAIQAATIEALFRPWWLLTSLGAYTLIRLFNELEKVSLSKIVLDAVDRYGPPMLCLDPSGGVTFANQGFAHTGLDVKDLKAQLCRGPSLLHQCLEQSAPLSREMIFSVNGELRVFLLRLKKMVLLQSDQGVGVLLRDITSLKTAAHSLQEFFSLSPDGFCVLDCNTFLQVSNGKLEQILGYNSQELALFPLEKLIHPEDCEQVQVVGKRLLNNGGRLMSYEVRYQHKGGTYRWLSWSCTGIPEQSAIYAIVRDVTEQKLQQRELTATTARVAEHAALLGLIQDAVVVRSMSNHILHFSAGAENMYGYKAAEVIGCETNLVLKTRFRQLHSAIFLELMERGSWKGIITQSRADGTPIMVESRWTIRRDTNGRPAEILEFSTDITKRLAQERSLNHLASIVEQSVDAMLRITLEGFIMSWNRGAERTYGYSSREVKGQKIHLLSTTHRRDWVDEMLHTVCLGLRVLDADTFIRHKNGATISTSCTMSPIRDGTGKLQAISVVIRDLTRLRLIEREVAKLERFNVVGQLAAGIGHEIRNPLTTVRGFLQLFAQKSEMAPFQEHLKIVLGELDAANNIINEFLQLAHNRPIAFAEQQLNSIIKALLPMLKADALMQDKQIKTKLGVIPEFPLNEKDIAHLIINLARNGLEAMPKRGVLTITTYEQHGQVLMRVEDEGNGIPETLLERIWLPFFTTKDRGVGLGLAVCEHIAMQHRASIDVFPGPPGAAFVVRFTLLP
ncbi:MAG: PAS domain-containing protein [Bacillota bacterium]|nr:MAG: PAS domain-containing protein [Bacillota bacterium]MBS3950512.1 PAS domain S-box protein [Peptococcaceae bacterium]